MFVSDIFFKKDIAVNYIKKAVNYIKTIQFTGELYQSGELYQTGIGFGYFRRVFVTIPRLTHDSHAPLT